MNESNDVTKVLIAHLTEDTEVSDRLRQQLLTFAADRLECILWDDSEPNLESLQQRIEGTDLLLLFVVSGSVNDRNWGWLQWATAMSRILINGHVSRILLHNRSLTPPQCIQVAIEYSYNSTKDQIIEFLKYFFGSSDFTQNHRPLNRRLIQDIPRLDDLSGNIQSWFQEPYPHPSSPPDVTIFLEAITLAVVNPSSLDRENLSENIWVQAKTPGAMAIFGFQDSRRSWNEVVNNLPQNNSQGWIEELESSIFSAHRGILPKVVQLTFRAHNGRVYKPILYKRSWTTTSEQFTVLFVEQISEGWVNAPNISLATLLTASILGARLQWEICDRYLPQLDAWQNGDTHAIQKNLRDIKLLFDNIEEDARIRERVEAPGLQNINRLRDSFDSDNDRQTIVKNMLEQEQHKNILRNADQQDTVNEVRVALTELKRLNQIVTAMVARRYSQLLNENNP